MLWLIVYFNFEFFPWFIFFTSFQFEKNKQTIVVTSVVCPIPESPKNGKAIYTSLSYNSVVSYECRYGYTLVNDSSRRCGADKRWSNGLPSCKEINCGSPGILYNGWLENLDAGTGLGASIIFRCQPGMLLVGNSSTVCQIDGRWRYPVPECLGKTFHSICLSFDFHVFNSFSWIIWIWTHICSPMCHSNRCPRHCDCNGKGTWSKFHHTSHTNSSTQFQSSNSWYNVRGGMRRPLWISDHIIIATNMLERHLEYHSTVHTCQMQKLAKTTQIWWVKKSDLSFRFAATHRGSAYFQEWFWHRKRSTGWKRALSVKMVSIWRDPVAKRLSTKTNMF